MKTRIEKLSDRLGISPKARKLALTAGVLLSLLSASSCLDLNLEPGTADSPVQPINCKPSNGETVSILFFGNSIVDYTTERLEALLQCEGYQTNFEPVISWGSPLSRHVEPGLALQKAQDLILNGAHDIVVLNDKPTIIPSHEGYSVLTELANQAGKEVWLYESQGYNPPTTEEHADTPTHIANVADLQLQYGGVIIPVGQTWQMLGNQYDFYLERDAPYWVHPNVRGEWMSACVFVAHIQCPSCERSQIVSDAAEYCQPYINF